MVEEVKYFRCWGVGHYKWECPNIEVERKRRSSMCGQATKGTAEGETGMSQLGKGAGILWSRECARRYTAVGVRMDDRRGCSNLHRM